MSQEIDRRIVEMQFDNAQFERGIHQSMKSLDEFEKSLQLENSAKGFETLGSAADKLAGNGLSKVTYATEEIKHEFSAMEAVAFSALQNITNKAINAGEKLLKSLTIDQVTAGYSKYEEKIQSVRTIMSATGREVEDVTNQLDRLNWFTDETSANFSDMVNNISKFTSNGIDLETSITATEGISTWAGLSGQSNAVASRAYYNLAQALGQGYVQAIDWRSIELANMATAEFKQNVIDTAVEEGRLLQVAEGVYETTSATAKAGVEVTVENFRSTLAEAQWFNNDVLVGTLKKYGDFSNALKEATDSTDLYTTDMLELIKSYKENVLQTDELGNYILDAEGNRVADSEVLKAWKENLDLNGQDADIVAKKVHELSQEMYDLGAKAFEANREARSFGQAVDAVKDAVSTRFTNIFQDIFGNAEEATEFFTDLSDWGFDMFAEPMESVATWFKRVFRGDAASGFDALEAKMEALGVSTESFEAALKKYGIENDKFTEEALENAGSLKELAQGGGFGWLDNNALSDILKSITGDSEAAVGSLEEVQKVVNDIIQGAYGNQPDRKGLLEAAGYDYEFYQNLVNKVWNGGSYDGVITVDDIKEIYELTGAESEAVKELVEGLENGDIAVDDILEQLKSTEMSGRDMFMRTINNVLGGLMFISDIAKQIWANLFPNDKTKGAKSFLNFLMNATGDITEFLSHTKVIAGTISNLLTPIVNTGKLAVKLVKNIVGLFGRIADGLGLRELFGLDEDSEALFGGFAKGANNLYEFLSGIIDLIDKIDVSNIVSGLKDTIEWVKKFFSNIKGFFKMDDMKSIGEWSLEGFVEGIKNGAKEAWNSVVDFFKEVVERVKNFLGIHSPSTIFMAIGAFVMLGFIKGIKDKLPKLENTFGLVFDLIRSVIEGYKEYFINKVFTEEGSKFEVFLGKVVLATELLKIKVKDNLKKAGESFKKFADNLKSSNYIFSFFGDYIDLVKMVYSQNSGNLWNTFWEMMSFNSKYYKLNRDLMLDKLAEFWETSVRTDAFNNWLNESISVAEKEITLSDGSKAILLDAKKSVFANTISQLVYIAETILRKDMTLFDKVKEIGRSFEDFHPIIDHLNNQIHSILETLWNNFDLILQIGKLAVSIKKLTSVTNMYDSIAFFFNDAKGVTTALKTAIESWSNPLARTGTITKKLSKSQAFFEIAKGIALIGASVWLIVKSFENVYNLVASADQAALIKTEGVIFGILSMLEVIILTIGIFTELISHSGLASLSGSVALNSIATAIKWLAIIIGELVGLSYFATKLRTGTLVAMGVTLVALTVVGVVLARSCQKLLGVAKDLTETQLLKTSGVFVGMMGFIIAFATLAVGLGILFAIKPGMIGYVIGSMIMMLGAIAALLGIVYKFMQSTKGLSMIDASWLSVGVSNVLLSLVAVIAALAAAVIILTLVIGDDWQKGAVAALALGLLTSSTVVLLGAAYLFIKSLSESLKDVKEEDIKNLKKTMLPVMIFVGGLIVALTAATVVLMKSINGTNKGMGTFALVLGGITVAILLILTAIGVFINIVVKTTKDADLDKEKEIAKEFDSLTKVLLSIGAMTVMLGAALYIVTAAFNNSDTKFGETNNAWKAMLAIGAILAVVGSVTYILIRSLKNVSVNTDLTKYTNNVLKIMAGIIALISVIAGSLWLLTYMNPSQLMTAAITMGAVLVAVVMIVTILIGSIKDAMSKTSISDKDKISKTESIADQLLKMVLAMSAMIGVISIALYAVSNIKGEDLVRSAIVIGALMGGVMLFIWALTKLTKESGIIKDADTGKGTKFNKVIKTVIPIVIGIVALCIAAIALGGIDAGSLKRGVFTIAVIGGMITAILLAVGLIFKNKTPNTSKWKNLGIVAIITTLVAGLVIVAVAIYQLSKVWNDDMWNATLLVLAIAGIISVLFLAIKGISAIKSTIDISSVLMVAAICGGVWVLADAIAKIGENYKKGEIWKAFGVVAAIGGLLAVLTLLFEGLAMLGAIPVVGGFASVLGPVLLGLISFLAFAIAAITASLGYLIGKITEFIAIFDSQPGMFDEVSDTTEESADKFKSVVSRKTSQIVQKIIDFVQGIVDGVREGIVQSQNKISEIIGAVADIITAVDSLIQTDPSFLMALNTLGSDLGNMIGNVLYNAISGAIKGAIVSVLTGPAGSIAKMIANLIGFVTGTDVTGLISLIDQEQAEMNEKFVKYGFFGALNEYQFEENAPTGFVWDPSKRAYVLPSNANPTNGLNGLAVKEYYQNNDLVPEGAYYDQRRGKIISTAAKNEASQQIEYIETGVQEAVDEYIASGSEESSGVGDFITNLLLGGNSSDDIMSNLQGMLDGVDISSLNIEDIVNSLFASGEEGGLNWLSGILNGSDNTQLKEQITKLLTDFVNNGIVNNTKKTMGERSPSVIAEEDGRNWLIGLSNGLSDYSALSEIKDKSTKAANIVAATFTSALETADTIDYTPTITPVLDFSTYDSQIASVNAALFAPKLSLNGKAIGEVGNMSGTITVVNDNRDIVKAVNDLQHKMDQVAQAIDGMQVVMDTRALVGQISTKMDVTLGRNTDRDNREGVKLYPK